MRHQQPTANAKRSAGTTRSVVAAIAVAGCMSVFAAVVAANADLSALIGAARENFTPVSDDQVADAHANLKAQAAALERYVRPHTSNGRKWLNYLRWDDFQQALDAEGPPEFTPLLATKRQLDQDENGLEYAPFRRLSDAIQRYVDVAVIARQEDQSAVYSRQLDGLAKELEEYRENPSAATGEAIGRRIDLVAGIGQAPELVKEVRAELARPNAFVTISTALLRDAANDPIDRHDPVTDCILGTSIRGRGHTTGKVELRTLPSEDEAVIELKTDGRVVSQNRGTNGPAVIRSTGFTNFDAILLVEFSADQFRAQPAKVRATTSSNIHSVSKAGGGIGSKFVSKIGMKKAKEKQGQANRIAADHAEDRIAGRMNDEIGDRLQKAWDRYRTEYRNPLERRGELPEHIRFSTTEDALSFESTQANRGQLAAPSDPPPLPADNDLVARVHETAINNYAAAMLGGATISESESGAGTKADVNLPKWIKDSWKNRMDEQADDSSDDEFQPWSLTFRNDRPIDVEFVDGKVELTLHIARLISGREFTRWDVTAVYTPEMTDGGVTLRRDSLDAVPVGRDWKELTSRSTTQSAERRNLIEELTKRSDQGRGIPETIRLDPLEPKDELADVGPLSVQDFTSGDGWLTVAWSRAHD